MANQFYSLCSCGSDSCSPWVSDSLPLCTERGTLKSLLYIYIYVVVILSTNEYYNLEGKLKRKRTLWKLSALMWDLGYYYRLFFFFLGTKTPELTNIQISSPVPGMKQLLQLFWMEQKFERACGHCTVCPPNHWLSVCPWRKLSPAN